MRKGVSSVIAVILLLLITIAIIGFAFVFFTKTVEISTEGGEEQLGQQIQQIGTNFQLEGVNKNQVFIRNMGATPLAGLAFYVNDVPVSYSGPASLAANAFGTYFLNDSQLAMLPDPAQLRVTSAGASSKMTANFYGAYIVGYWKFDEGSGITAIDSSGNGNGGTINGPTYTSGKYGAALNLDGTDDYVNVLDSGSLDSISSAFTIDAWVKDTDPVGGGDDDRNIASKGDIGDYQSNTFLFKIGGSKKLELYIGSGTASDYVTGATPLQPDTFYHVTGVFDGSAITVYVNGVQDAVPFPKTIGNLINAGNLVIGRQSESDCDVFYRSCWKGIIDEIRILKIARSMTTS